MKADWPAPIEGVLRIQDHGFKDRPPGLEASLHDPRGYSIPIQVLQPLFDPVLVGTHGAGFLLRGREVWTQDVSARLIRDVGQVWFVVPMVQ